MQQKSCAKVSDYEMKFALLDDVTWFCRWVALVASFEVLTVVQEPNNYELNCQGLLSQSHRRDSLAGAI